jgi:hypothetical protein
LLLVQSEKHSQSPLTLSIVAVRRHTPRSPLLDLNSIVASAQAGRIGGVAGCRLDDGLLEAADGALGEVCEAFGLGGGCGGEVEEGEGEGDLHFGEMCCDA